MSLYRTNHAKECYMSSTTLDSIIKSYRSQPNQLIEVLQDVQEKFGYVSEESMRTISENLGVPVLEVYRVASFYKAFSLKPRGKNVITLCMGTACHVRGAKLIMNQALGQLNIKPGETTDDGLFTIEQVNCVGACALAPVVTENETYHHHMTPGKLRKLIKSIKNRDVEGTSHE